MIGRSRLSRRDILYKGLSIIILFVHTIRQNSGSVSEDADAMDISMKLLFTCPEHILILCTSSAFRSVPTLPNPKLVHHHLP